MSKNKNSQIEFPAPKQVNASSSGTDTGIICSECKKKRSGRVYRCNVCAKSSINELQANGIPPQENPSMIQKTARLASRVVIGFVEGLVEGLGEGVGEYYKGEACQNIKNGE